MIMQTCIACRCFRIFASFLIVRALFFLDDMEYIYILESRGPRGVDIDGGAILKGSEI